MNWLNLIRKIVLLTNPYPPFSYLNKLPYHWAAWRIVAICRKLPQVASLYARSSYAHGDFIPGSSDIDLMLLFKGESDAARENAFLEQFGQAYESAERFFPMLGEVSIIDARYIDTYTQFNMDGYESKFWRLLHGKAVVKQNYDTNTKHFTIDAINQALDVYLEEFMIELHLAETDLEIPSLIMYRVAAKLLKYAHYAGGQKDYKPGAERKETIAGISAWDGLLLFILRTIEHHIMAFNSFRSQDECAAETKEIDAEALLGGAEINVIEHGEAPVEIRESGDCESAVLSMFLASTRPAAIFVILKDDLSDSILRACIRKVCSILLTEETTPVIMTQRIFEYYVSYYDPFMYLHLLSRRKILDGKDPMAGLRVPSESDYGRAVISRSIELVLDADHPRGMGEEEPGDEPEEYVPDTFGEDGLVNTLLCYLNLKLYLEQQVIHLTLDDLLPQIRGSDPDIYTEILAILEVEGGPGDNPGNWKSGRFGLLRRLRGDLVNAITHS